MTPAQRTALRYPCFLAFECLHPRYGQVAPCGTVTVMVTINAGYE